MSSERPAKRQASMEIITALPVVVSLGVSLGPAAQAQTIITGSHAGTVNLAAGQYPAGNPFTITAGTTIATMADGVYGGMSQGWTLINAGTLTAGNNGVDLVGGGAVTNQSAGVIQGAHMGVYTGAAASISNAGRITATNGTGVSLYAGGSFTNSAGGIVTAGYAGVYTSGASGTVANAGTITGARYGIDMVSAGSVTNAGTITGGEYGVRIAGPGSLTNSGRIVQTQSGQSYAAIALNHGGYLLNNPGAVISGNPAGVLGRGAALDVTNAGTIAGTLTGLSLGAGGTLHNTGLITGQTTALYAGPGATILSTGTIAAGPGGTAIQFGPGQNQLTLGTGAVVDGAIAGGNAAGTIALTGHGTLAGTLENFGPGAEISLKPGADWQASGNWQIPTFINAGTLRAGLPAAPLRLTGNFLQAAPGTLVVTVTSAASARFLITGHAVLAGNLVYAFAPGHYSPATYQFLTAGGGVSGRFARVAYVGAASSALVAASPSLTTLSLAPIARPEAAASANLVLSAPLLVAPADDSLFPAQAQLSARDTQRDNTTLLGAAEQPPAPGCATPPAATPPAANPLGQGVCRAGGWLITDDTATQATDNHAASSHFLAGIDRAVNTTGTRIGLATGYEQSWLHDSAGGKSDAATTWFGLYAAQPIGAFTLAADFLYGHEQDNTRRLTGAIASAGTALSRREANHFAAAAALQVQIHVGAVTITPQTGIRAARVAATGFAEAGAAPYTLHGGGDVYTSIIPFIGATLSRNFTTGSGTTLTPSFSASYDYEAADTQNTALLTTADGTEFAAQSSPSSRNQTQLAVALTAGHGRWMFTLRYSADLAGNWTAQSGAIGLKLNF